MSLQIQNVPLVFARGINTKADPKTVQAELLELENATFTKTGTLSTRYGYDTLGRAISGTATSVSSGDAVAVYGNELLQFAAGNVLSYAPSTGEWMYRGAARSCLATTKDVIRNTYQQTNPDVAEANGVRVVVWEDSRGGVRWTISDASSGAVIDSDKLLRSSATKPRAVAFGNDLVVFYADGANLYYRKINTALPATTTTEVNVVSTLKAANNHYDVCYSGNRLVFAFNNNAGAISMYSLSTTYVLSSSVARAIDADNCLTLAPDNAAGEFWLVWCAAAGQVYSERRSSATLGTITGYMGLEAVAALRISAAVATSNGTLTAFYEIAGASNNLNRVRTNTMTQAGVVGTAASCRRGIGLVGRAFAVSGIVYAVVAHESPSATALQSTVFVVDSAGNVFARLFMGETGGLRSTSCVSSVASTASGGYIFAATRKGELVTESGVTFTRVGIATCLLDFSTARRFQSVEAAGVLHIVGGAIQMYDGIAVVEHGFHLYPEGLSAIIAAGTGSLSAGAYQWVAVYEWTDRTGRVHRSAPSPALSYTATALDKASVDVPTLRLTGKSDVRVVLYRTLANGSTFYRVTSPTSPTLNDPTADTVTILDGNSDATIAANEFLYTTGDVLEHIPPGACAVACNYRGRIAVAGMSDPLKVGLSKVIQDGEPAAFNDILTFQVDGLGGDITALAPLNDKLIIFKKTAIFLISGNGPTATGQGSDYGDPQLLTSDVGSVGPVVAQTPLGLMFKSGKGIYLLDWALNVKYIGDRVEGYNSLGIRGAAVVPNTNQVRFVTDSARTLVYDYAFDQWGTFTNYAAVDCDVWNGAWVHLRSDGTACVENTSSYRDGSAPVELFAATGWVQVADMQGFQRAQRLAVLGDYYSPHILEVAAAFDFSPAWRQTHSFNMTTLFGGTTYGSASPYGTGIYGGTWAPYEVSLHLAQQKCTAVRFAFRVRQTGTGAGASITAMTMRIGTKQGLNKLGTGKRS